MLYYDNEINMESEKSLEQFDQRNISFENISQECDENYINMQKNDLCLKKSEKIFDSKSFMKMNSNYELISQDSKSDENIYFNIRTADNKQSLGEDFCEDNLFFSSLDESNKDILPKLSVFYPIGKELLIKEIFKTGLYGVFFIREYLYLKKTNIGKIFFNWCNSLKKYFSNNDDMKKYFSKIDPIYFSRETEDFRGSKNIVLNVDIDYEEFDRQEGKNLSENLGDLGIVNRVDDDYLLPKLFEMFHGILVIKINNWNKIRNVLVDETLRKFFIRRIRDYIEYIKKNNNNLLLKLEQQKKEDIIFIEEFLKQKQPPFKFSNGEAKQYFKSHSSCFFLFVISRNIIILICRELMKEDDDYLKKVFNFKKYPKYYLKIKEALSLF